MPYTAQKQMMLKQSFSCCCIHRTEVKDALAEFLDVQSVTAPTVKSQQSTPADISEDDDEDQDGVDYVDDDGSEVEDYVDDDGDD